MVEKVAAYKSADGVIWPTAVAAHTHEAELALRARYGNSDGRDSIEWMIKDAQFVCDVLINLTTYKRIEGQ